MPVETRLERLNDLVGDWKTTLTMINPDGSDGVVSNASDIYSWSPNGKFLLHDVDADVGGERVQSMEVFALDPSGSGYFTHSYDADGTVNTFDCTLDRGALRLTGTRQRFAGQLSQDGRTLTGRWEQKDEDDWSPLMKVVLRKP